MGWKPEVKVGEKWHRNGLTFATKEEAERSAHNLFMRWTSCDDHRAVEVDWAHVNYRLVGDQLIHIGEPETKPAIVRDEP
jgi:hypothetical protein